MFALVSDVGIRIGTFNLTAGATIFDLPEVVYNLGLRFRIWVYFIILVCLVMGVFIMRVFRENLDVTKWAFHLLIKKIPCVLFLYTHGYCYLYEVFNIDSVTEQKQTAVSRLQMYYYNAGIVGKHWVPFLMFLGWAVGFLIIELFRKNKDIQKASWQLLIFKIPGLLFGLMYGYCFMYGLF